MNTSMMSAAQLSQLRDLHDNDNRSDQMRLADARALQAWAAERRDAAWNSVRHAVVAHASAELRSLKLRVAR